MMVSSEKSVRYAAENAMNAMSAGLSTDTLAELVDIYAQIRSRKEGKEYKRGECWAVSRPVHVARTMEEARRNFEEPLLRQHNYQAHYRDDPQAFLKRIYGNPNEQSSSNVEITWEFLLNRSSFAGSPEDIVEQITRLQEKTGIGYINCYMDPGGISHKDIMSCIELFGSKVIPALT
jgi:alkanesulfonate monooxygenase SsuD/methylene tetrahydromethanopterin reductase-like flavin-dependent oxidoreductase (luciferase family)